MLKLIHPQNGAAATARIRIPIEPMMVPKAIDWNIFIKEQKP